MNIFPSGAFTGAATKLKFFVPGHESLVASPTNGVFPFSTRGSKTTQEGNGRRTLRNVYVGNGSAAFISLMLTALCSTMRLYPVFPDIIHFVRSCER